MKRAVSISLGSPSRDKSVLIKLNGVEIMVERIGTGGDTHKTRSLFNELDGLVDVFSLGGIDLYVHLDGRDYPIHAAHKLIQDVQQTPVVDGRMLKYALEGRLFERAATLIDEALHFKHAFIPFGTDRIGLIQSVSQVSDAVWIGDLMFIFGLPIAVKGLTQFKRVARLLLPLAGYLPIRMLFPPGARDEDPQPKYKRYWERADLIAGDMHYICKYSPDDLSGKTIITNTTTPDNINLLKQRKVYRVITTTPIYDGRSFGVNMMEAVLTAYSGHNRPLSIDELSSLIDHLDLRPCMQILNPK